MRMTWGSGSRGHLHRKSTSSRGKSKWKQGPVAGEEHVWERTRRGVWLRQSMGWKVRKRPHRVATKWRTALREARVEARKVPWLFQCQMVVVRTGRGGSHGGAETVECWMCFEDRAHWICWKTEHRYENNKSSWGWPSSFGPEPLEAWNCHELSWGRLWEEKNIKGNHQELPFSVSCLLKPKYRRQVNNGCVCQTSNIHTLVEVVPSAKWVVRRIT